MLVFNKIIELSGVKNEDIDPHKKIIIERFWEVFEAIEKDKQKEYIMSLFHLASSLILRLSSAEGLKNALKFISSRPGFDDADPTTIATSAMLGYLMHHVNEEEWEFGRFMLTRETTLEVIRHLMLIIKWGVGTKAANEFIQEAE